MGFIARVAGIAAILGVLAPLTGCATKVYRQPVDSKSYVLGTRMSASVGSAIVDRERESKAQYEVWMGIFMGNWVKTRWSLEEGSLKEQLLYSGRTGDTMKLSYREYRVANTQGPPAMGQAHAFRPIEDFLAAPAFYQDLQYDLSESDTVAFRNFRLQVHEARNDSISYTVLSD